MLSSVKIKFTLKERSLGKVDDLKFSEKVITLAFIQNSCADWFWNTEACHYFQCMEKRKWDNRMQTHSNFSSERKEHETFKIELNTAIPRGRLCWKIWTVPSLPCYQNKAVHYGYNIHVKYTNQIYVFKVFVLIPLTKMFKNIRMCFECFTIYLYICLFIFRNVLVNATSYTNW